MKEVMAGLAVHSSGRRVPYSSLAGAEMEALRSRIAFLCLRNGQNLYHLEFIILEVCGKTLDANRQI